MVDSFSNLAVSYKKPTKIEGFMAMISFFNGKQKLLNSKKIFNPEKSTWSSIWLGFMGYILNTILVCKLIIINGGKISLLTHLVAQKTLNKFYDIYTR